MRYYEVNGTRAASFLKDLPFPRLSEGKTELFLTEQEPWNGPTAWLVTDPRQLTAKTTDISWLDPHRMDTENPELPKSVFESLQARQLTAVNLWHPCWQRALTFPMPKRRKKRVHLLAVGDVGGILLTALKLLGGGLISTIGIHDLNEKAVTRWEMEMGQIFCSQEWGYLPEVESVNADQLFDCDVFLFAAAKAVPALDSGIQDVRMAQLEANRPLVESFARQARERTFQGLFIVLSDPVDHLCQAAWRASNTSPEGTLDGLGLLPEQIQGFGLGVMNARAAYFAKRDPRFADFLTEGRVFGPHGEGLVVANSLEHYHDGLSQELTALTLESNLRIRELGFKPYVAPAVSSGAMQLLLALNGDWHYSSIPLGGVWFGVRNRFTPRGLEIETAHLPDVLFERLRSTERLLHQ